MFHVIIYSYVKNLTVEDRTRTNKNNFLLVRFLVLSDHTQEAVKVSHHTKKAIIFGILNEADFIFDTKLIVCTSISTKAVFCLDIERKRCESKTKHYVKHINYTLHTNIYM